MTTTVDGICDAIVTALGAIDFTALGFDLDKQISTQCLPIFDLIDATETTQIKVAAYPNIENRRIDRTTIQADHKIGIAILKSITQTNGGPDETEFRKLKLLAESIREWCWTALHSTYGYKVVEVGFPAWYDLEKAKNGVFLTVIQPVFRLGAEL